MPELVFIDQRLPLKRKWHDGAPHAFPSVPPRTLPRLPSLSAWANINPPASPPLPSIQTIASPPTNTASSEPETAEAPPAKRATPMRNTSRERMKAEQASLRAQALTLETELACLRQLRHERLAASLGSSFSSSSSSSSSGLLGWQEMAQRHWDQRIASERENKRLREAVNGLATEVKGLEALFNSRSSALMASLKQNAQLAVELQEMLAQQPPSEFSCKNLQSLRRPGRSTQKDKKHTKKLAQPQQSPRDVACAMEAPQSPYGL